MIFSTLQPEFFFRLFLNFGAIVVLVLTLSLSSQRNRDVVFNYLMFGSVVFLVAYTLKSTAVSAGLGLGLFAVFGVLRFRTMPISTRELTYLYIVIAISMVNAISSFQRPVLIAINVLLVAAPVLAQIFAYWNGGLEHNIIYEKVELINPLRYGELVSDLQDRLGVVVTRVEVGEINFLRDTVMLKVYYRLPHMRAGHDSRPNNIALGAND